MESQKAESKITVERRGHVLLIGLNRPAKRNAFDLEMLDQLALAYAELEDDPEIRCGVLWAEGEMFTAGLDLANVAPAVVRDGVLKYPEGAIDPLAVEIDDRETCIGSHQISLASRKPVNCQRWCG